MNDFLLTLSGARPQILQKCPTERIKFQSLGWAILITSGMAAVSMWFALSSAMGANPFLALPAALMWGLIIMGIDRWLVTSMPAGDSRRWVIAIPRVLLAVLLGTLVSTPLVLRIFQSEINSEIAVIKEQRASTFIAAQQGSQVGKQVAHWQADVAGLQKVIDSGGQVTLNPAADPQIQSLTRQRNAEVTLEHKYYEQWQCQLYGGQGCTVRGNGPLAAASENSYHQAQAQVAAFTNQIQQREKHLTASDSASRHLRLRQATAALPGAQQQLSVAVARQDALRQNFDTQNEATNGLLIRLQALTALSGNSFTLNAARLLLFLLFLVIECLPVTVKIMQQPGNYERILQAEAEKELREATRALRTRPRLGTQPVPDANPISTTADLRELWQQTTPMPSWATATASAAAADTSPDDADESDEHTRLDHEALREMPEIEDMRANADSGQRGGGFELSFGADER
jgi:Domain of unknown function (DUF4407)